MAQEQDEIRRLHRVIQKLQSMLQTAQEGLQGAATQDSFLQDLVQRLHTELHGRPIAYVELNKLFHEWQTAQRPASATDEVETHVLLVDDQTGQARELSPDELQRLPGLADNPLVAILNALSQGLITPDTCNAPKKSGETVMWAKPNATD